MSRAHPSAAAMIATALSLGVFAANPSLTASAADPLVPPAVQAALTVRVLEYDRSLKDWASGGLAVGLVTKGANAASEYGAGLAAQQVQGLPVVVSTLVYRDATSLAQWIDEQGIRLVYVSPDLGAEAREVVSTATSAGRPTLAATRSQFEAGGTLAIVVREGKPHILVHLAGSKAAGMNLDPKLLQLAEVVR